MKTLEEIQNKLLPDLRAHTRKYPFGCYEPLDDLAYCKNSKSNKISQQLATEESLPKVLYKKSKTKLTDIKNQTKRADTDYIDFREFCVSEPGFKFKAGRIPDKQENNPDLEASINKLKTFKEVMDSLFPRSKEN